MTAPHQESRPEPPSPPPRRGVVAVVVRGSRLLVIRRSMAVVAPGAYCFPGGGIEEGESEAEALCREFREELGAPVRPVRCIWRCVTASHVDLVWWLTDLDDEAKLVASPAEVDAFSWHTPEEIEALPGLLESNIGFLGALRSQKLRSQKLWPQNFTIRQRLLQLADSTVRDMGQT